MPEEMAQPAPLRRNAIWNMLGRGLSASLWIVVTPWVLSRLGQERFAVWALFFALSGYVATLDFGMASGVARHVAVGVARGDRHGIDQVLRRSLIVSVGLGLVWCVVFIGFRRLFLAAFHVPAEMSDEVMASLAVFAGAMFVFSSTQVLVGGLIGFQKLHLSNAFTLAGLLLHAAVLVVGLGAGGGLVAAACAAVAGHTLTGLLAGRVVWRDVGAMKQREGQPGFPWRELLAYGGIIQATNAFAMGWLQGGKILIGILGHLALVTQFELGFRVANAIASLPVLIQGAIIPAAAHASGAGGILEVAGTYRWGCRWVYAVGAMVLAGLWLVAPGLYLLWLGPGHAVSASIARGLALVFTGVILVGPSLAVARGGGWPELETIQLGFALLGNIALALWSVPRFGAQGAVFAMGVSFTVSAAWLILAMHRRLGVSTWEWARVLVLPRFVGPAVASAALALAFGRWHAEDRTGGLVMVAVQGGLFLVLATLLAWPNGDPRAVMTWAHGRLRGAYPFRAAGRTP
jgi:O-antigen/teichoic acid export membrane protein